MMTAKRYIRMSLVTGALNTMIALLIHQMVVRGERFRTVFIVSQITGLSIGLCIQWSVTLWEKRFPERMRYGVAAGLFGGVGMASVLVWMYLNVSQGLSFIYYYRNVLSTVAVFGVLFGAPTAYFFRARTQLAESALKVKEEKIKRLSMEKEAAETGLRLLQAQIEPHFLFNTLSNVIMLMETDPSTAKQMLTDLTAYLRISLDRTRQEMITLSQELSLVSQYLSIFKIRMGDRLNFTVNDRTNHPDLPFPPLIVQTLVIDIADTGRGLDDSGGSAGIGINNVSQRLARIYGSGAGLTLAPNRPEGLVVRIEVPV